MVQTLKRPPKKVHPDQTRVITPQHNGPSDEAILVMTGELISVRADKAALSKVEKKIRQRMVNAGMKVQQIDMALRLSDMGPKEVQEMFQHLLNYARVLSVPIGTQLSFFTDPGAKTPSLEDELKKAFDWGKTLSLLGKDPDFTAYQKEGPLGQEHLKGWNAGQQVRHAQLIQNSEDEAARKKKADEDAAAKVAAKTAKAEKKAKSGKGKAEQAVRDEMAKLDDAPEEEAVH